MFFLIMRLITCGTTEMWLISSSLGWLTRVSDVVPFYGMGKRSSSTSRLGGTHERYHDDVTSFLPQDFNILRERSNTFGEMRKRSDYLASYCCDQLAIDDCCDVTSDDKPMTSSLSDDSYYFADDSEAGDCYICIERQNFNYEYCLECLRRKWRQ